MRLPSIVATAVAAEGDTMRGQQAALAAFRELAASLPRRIKA